MKIGVDFDNTIISYDSVFHKVALEQDMITKDVRMSKAAVRDHMRSRDHEEEWIRMQGYVYGSRLGDAKAFPGAVDFFLFCKKIGLTVYIISHKTLHPYSGEKYDLHKSAREWLESQRFFHPEYIGLTSDEVFFELTKAEKAARIESQGCDYFIDDLPEFLEELSLEPLDRRILFDPNGNYENVDSFRRFSSWEDITRFFHKVKP